MNELVVIQFSEKNKADEVMLSLLELEQGHLIDLEDAVVLTKNAVGKVRIKPYYDLVAAIRGLNSRFWGEFITTLFGISSNYTSAELGIDQKFCDELKTTMQPNSSAIFILVRQANPEEVIKELSKFQGKILRTILMPEQQAKLEETVS